MTQDLLSYWKPETADANLEQGGLLNHAASNQYHRVHARDTVWIVTVRAGELRLLGRIHVGQVTDGAQAAKALGTRDLWEADFHILAEPGSAHTIQDIPIAPLAPHLRFLSRTGNDRLVVSNGNVNPQQLQTMRVLSPDSAALLEEALADRVSDQPSPSVSSATQTKRKTSTAVTSREPQRETVLAALGQLQAAGRRSSDLLKGQYRNSDRTEIPLNGLCYVLSECMVHLFPGLFTSYRISWGDGTTHWFLRFSDGTILDTIAENGQECIDSESYEMARRAAFLTKVLSRRSRVLLDRAGLAAPAQIGGQ